MPKGEKKTLEACSREVTIHLHKALFGSTLKTRATHAVKVIRSAAAKAMKTSDVRIDVALNKYLWAHGAKNVPTRIRVVFHRRMNEDEDAKEKFYTHVNVVDVPTFKGLATKVVEAEN